MTDTVKSSAIKGKAMTEDTGISGRAASLSKLKLLTSASLTAAVILLSLTPEAAFAQAAPSPSGHAVNANPDIASGQFTLGSGSFISGPTVDTVQIDSDQVIIDWNLVDETGSGTINFLPSDNGLVFDRINGGDYTVLNRIVPSDQTRGIGIDGNVSSFSGGNTAGNIWFYSPGGIIAGAGSNFNVGSLLLTTNAINTGGGLFGPNGEIRFNGPAGSTSGITIANGAQINALEDNSYVAMVAPRIIQGGTVTVNGSVGYVAAEQADITINNGLFDIAVTVGSESNSGIEHTGTTTGPTRDRSSGLDNQIIYMVAVPKNQAMTMLLSGSIGYVPATGAMLNEDDGSIILSAGGNVDNSGVIDETIIPSRSANINITNSNFSNDVTAFANDDIILDASAGGLITAAQDINTLDLTFTSGNMIRMEAGNTGLIDLDGNVTLNAINSAQVIARQDSSINIGGSLEVNAFSETQGGIIDILASGSGSRITGSGEIIIDDSLTVNAGIVGVKGNDAVLENGIDTFGGTINLDIVAGGLIDINSNNTPANSLFDVSAAPIMGTVTAGEATGGVINVNIDGTGSTITHNGLEGLIFDAAGRHGRNILGSSTGGASYGGTVNFNMTGGTINSGYIFVNTNARATDNGEANGVINTGVSQNNANAGNITANFTDATLNITNNLQFDNTAKATIQYDGNGDLSDGIATAGVMNITFDNTDLNGNSLLIDGYTSGNNIAGDIFLNVINGSNLSLSGDVLLYANGSIRSSGTVANSSNISLLVDNASLSARTYYLDASRNTKAPINALTDGTTGSINVMIQNGGSMTGETFDAVASARTFTDGGTATAGDISLNIDGGTMAIGDGSFSRTSVFLTASGEGRGNIDNGLAAERGLGIGGNIAVSLNNGGNFSADGFSSNSSGQIRDFSEGPIPIRGQGGNGLGGLTTFNLNSGNFIVGDMSVSSTGIGSFGGDSSPFGFPQEPGIAGDGGDGQGGDVVFNLNGADVIANNLLILANGFGGNGGEGSDVENVAGRNAGTGTGGNATLNATSGSLTVTGNFAVVAEGAGGRGGDGFGVNAGSGGDAIGGNATLNISGTASISASPVSITTNAFGGQGGDAQAGLSNSPLPPQRAGDGGNAIAGSAVLNNSGGTFVTTALDVNAVGTGGDAGNDPNAPPFQPGPFPPLQPVGYVGQSAGNGGSGTGGIATVNLGHDDSGNPLYLVNADGIGAKGGEGNNGGNAGDGIGGTASLNITDAIISLDSPQITAKGIGGSGGVARAVSGNGGNGGSAQGGIARLNIAGAGATLTTTGSPLSIISNAFGGDGAVGSDNSSGDGGNGGDGGSAAGGTTEISVRTGAELAISDPSYTLSSTGTGGQGGNGGISGLASDGQGGDGGQGTGGTARMLAQGGTITGNDVTIITTGQGGGAGFGGIAGPSGIIGSGTGGTAILEVQEGSPGILTLGNVTLISNGFNGGDISIPTGTGGSIEIIDASTDPAGLITFGSLYAEALNGAASTNGFSLSGNSGTTNVTGDFTVNVAGNAIFTFDGDGQLNIGGNTTIDTPQNLIVIHTNRSAGFDSIISAGDFIANIGGDIDTIADSRLRSGSTIDFSAGGAISFNRLYADTDVNLSASSGDITGDIVSGNNGINITTPGFVTVGSLITQQGPLYSVDVTGDQGIEIQSLTSGIAFLNSILGDIAVRDDASVTGNIIADGRNIFLRSTGNMQAAADATDGSIDIVSNGDLLIYGARATANISLSSTGGSTVITETITQAGGDISVSAATDVFIERDTLATNNLSITAGQGIVIQALTTGTTIDLSSADLNISSSGQLGELNRTNDIYIESNGANQAVLGGTGTTGVFSLSEEEFGRIQANQNLTFFAQATGASTPDLVIQDLTIATRDDVGSTQAATLGFAGTLTIDSGQSTRVDGKLNLTNAAPEAGLNMTAVNDIRINANGGLIQITDGNNGFGSVGFMSLYAQNIYAMTDQAFTDIAGLNLRAVNQRLGDNDGIDLDSGLIRAGVAEFSVERNLFIQNTAPEGDFNTRRGFSVGSLTISGLSSSSTTNIVANGIVGGATGSDTIPATTVEANYDIASTINGCLIANPASCGAPVTTIDPVQDVIKEELSSGDNDSAINDPLDNNLIEIKETEDFINDPLIDEPVTGAGNDDLWIGDNDGEDNGACEIGDTECEQSNSSDEDALEPAE